MKRRMSLVFLTLLIGSAAARAGESSFDGVAAYEGRECIELVKRFIESRGYRYSGVDGLARNLAMLVQSERSGFEFLKFYSNNGMDILAPGDIIGWDGGETGHVAIVRKVTMSSTGPSSVEILEQNWPGGLVKTLPLRRERYRFFLESRGKHGQYIPQGWCRLTIPHARDRVLLRIVFQGKKSLPSRVSIREIEGQNQKAGFFSAPVRGGEAAVYVPRGKELIVCLENDAYRLWHQPSGKSKQIRHNFETRQVRTFWSNSSKTVQLVTRE